MGLPNVGVTGVIQDPGLGGTLARGLGGITQMLMAQQQLKDQRAKDAANIAYQNELTTASRTGREAAAQEALLARQQAEQQEQRSRAAIEGLQQAGTLTAGQVAGLFQLPVVERAKKLTEWFGPQTLAGDARIVQQTGAGQYGTVVGADTAMKATDNSTDFRNFLAGTINPENGRPYDPNTPPSKLSKEQAKAWVDYQRTLETVRAPKGNSMTVAAGNSFAEGLGKAAAESIAQTKVMARDAATDLNTINELRPLVEEGIIAGFGANTITKMGSLLAQVGIGGKGEMSAVARTQAYAAIVGQRVGQVIKLFGAGTGLSDADREYATKIAGGDIEMTPEALKRVLDMGERADRYLVNTHNQSVDDLPDSETPASVKRTLRVTAPAPSAGPAKAAGRMVKFEGTAYPVIVGSDGASYISTPKGTFKVGG